MMTTTKRFTPWIAAILWITAAVTLSGVAQTPHEADSGATSGSAPRILLIDETRTFASTMRVGRLAGALRQGGVDLEVRLETFSSSYVDPLAADAAPRESFDLILIVPIGIEDGSVPEVWLLYGSSTGAPARSEIEPLRGLLSAVFEGLAVPLGAAEDLWVACLASLYETQGWLR